MQIMLTGGGTGTHHVTNRPLYCPITPAVFALGTQEVGGMIVIPEGMPEDLCAQLAYRFFETDDAQSAGDWIDVDTVVAGPSKAFKRGDIPSVAGLRIQLGLKLCKAEGASEARAWLQYPMVVVV